MEKWDPEKHTQMDITVSFRRPSRVRRQTDFQVRVVISRESGQHQYDTTQDLSAWRRQRGVHSGDEKAGYGFWNLGVWTVLPLHRPFPPTSMPPKAPYRSTCRIHLLLQTLANTSHLEPNAWVPHPLLPSERILLPNYPTHNVSPHFFYVL